MSDRCEPPPELRGVDGWHEIERPSGGRFIAEWHPQLDGCWSSEVGAIDADTAYGIYGWRYLSPVATPAEVEALRAEMDAMFAEARKAVRNEAIAVAGQAILREEVATLRARVAELEGVVEAADAAMEFMHPLSNSGMTDTEFASLWNATHEALRAALSPATEAAPE